MNGNELRKGDVINLKGKVVEVVKTGFCKTGARGSAYTQLELKDIDTGKKREDRVRDMCDNYYCSDLIQVVL